MVFGRTELIISVSASKTKFDVEADGEVHLDLNPLNPNQKHKKLFFWTELFRRFFFSASKNETSGIVWSAFSQSFELIRAEYDM